MCLQWDPFLFQATPTRAPEDDEWRILGKDPQPLFGQSSQSLTVLPLNSSKIVIFCCSPTTTSVSGSEEGMSECLCSPTTVVLDCETVCQTILAFCCA